MMQILSKDCNDNMETIIGGDYNCVLNSELDRKNCSSNYDAGQRDAKYLMDIFELEDVWLHVILMKRVLHGRGGENNQELITG